MKHFFSRITFPVLTIFLALLLTSCSTKSKNFQSPVVENATLESLRNEKKLILAYAESRTSAELESIRKEANTRKEQLVSENIGIILLAPEAVELINLSFESDSSTFSIADDLTLDESPSGFTAVVVDMSGREIFRTLSLSDPEQLFGVAVEAGQPTNAGSEAKQAEAR